MTKPSQVRCCPFGCGLLRTEWSVPCIFCVYSVKQFGTLWYEIKLISNMPSQFELYPMYLSG